MSEVEPIYRLSGSLKVKEEYGERFLHRMSVHGRRRKDDAEPSCSDAHHLFFGVCASRYAVCIIHAFFLV